MWTLGNWYGETIPVGHTFLLVVRFVLVWYPVEYLIDLSDNRVSFTYFNDPLMVVVTVPFTILAAVLMPRSVRLIREDNVRRVLKQIEEDEDGVTCVKCLTRSVSISQRRPGMT